jgi:hypothetical protein
MTGCKQTELSKSESFSCIMCQGQEKEKDEANAEAKAKDSV